MSGYTEEENSCY